jgi:hypothetical protein
MTKSDCHDAREASHNDSKILLPPVQRRRGNLIVHDKSNKYVLNIFGFIDKLAGFPPVSSTGHA